MIVASSHHVGKSWLAWTSLHLLDFGLPLLGLPFAAAAAAFPRAVLGRPDAASTPAP